MPRVWTLCSSAGQACMQRHGRVCSPVSDAPTLPAALQFGGSGLAHAHPLWALRPAANAPRRKRDGKTRVLILMSDTGGGHRASAEAIKAGACMLSLSVCLPVCSPLFAGRQPRLVPLLRGSMCGTGSKGGIAAMAIGAVECSSAVVVDAANDNALAR